MRIPTIGKECPYFYGDYYRGKEHEECRLVGSTDPNWKLELCQTCPVPDIVRANSCPNMILTGEINSGLFGLRKRMKISAYCTKTHRDVQNPYIGCGECHPIIDLFKEAK